MACSESVGDIDRLRRRAPGGLRRLRQSKVEDFHRAVRPHFDVRGFQIAVNDPLLMRGFERVRDLFRNGQRLIKRNRAARDALREIVALDEFHDERGGARTFFKPVDGGDVRMIERGEHFRFALKAREPIGISRERGWQDLNRDLTFQLGVRRPIHLTHPAFADLRGDVVNAEACAGCKEQCLRDYTGAAVARTGLLLVHAAVSDRIPPVG